MDTKKVKTKKIETAAVKNASSRKVNFKFFAPLSLKVSVAGTFNNWDLKKGGLKKDASGTWSGVFEAKSGRHEYRFVVDGNWENDQNNNEIVPNNLGTFNNILIVQ